MDRNRPDPKPAGTKRNRNRIVTGTGLDRNSPELQSCGCQVEPNYKQREPITHEAGTESGPNEGFDLSPFEASLYRSALPRYITPRALTTEALLYHRRVLDFSLPKPRFISPRGLALSHMPPRFITPVASSYHHRGTESPPPRP